MSGRSVLFVVTNHSFIAANHRSGLWFEELALPYRLFAAEGYRITIASPLGGLAPVDPYSMPSPEHVQDWIDIIEQLVDTTVLAELSADDFDAIVVPGGHGPMYDLPHCVALHQLLCTFDQAGKVIATICHGAAGLIGAAGADGRPLVTGRRITGFTDAEERTTGLEQVLPFLLETQLRERDANFVAEPNWSDHVEQDGHLITGQNPQSTTSVARAVIAALDAKQH